MVLCMFHSVVMSCLEMILKGMFVAVSLYVCLTIKIIHDLLSSVLLLVSISLFFVFF